MPSKEKVRMINPGLRQWHNVLIYISFYYLGNSSEDEKAQFEKDGEGLKITKEEMVPLLSANLFLFFVAGFDTTSLGK